MSVESNIQQIITQLPRHIRLVAVTKTVEPDVIRHAYQAGLRDFGENRAQELMRKAPVLPPDIRWHYIGHLQRNKVRQIIPFVSLIHSTDSLRLLEVINHEASRAGRQVDVLLQFHIAEEETKYGLDLDEAIGLLNSPAYASMHHVRICGVMGMATFTGDMTQVRKEFRHLFEIYSRLKSAFFNTAHEFCEISMGMSGDYRIAIEEGSTILRIGSAIFSEE